MTSRSQDLIVGTILLAVSIFWCWASLTTIPDTFSGPVGARGFPLLLGGMLGVLSLFVIVEGLRKAPAAVIDGDEAGTSDETHIPLAAELWAIGVPTGILIAYIMLLWAFGFLIASVIITAIGLVAIGETRPRVFGGLLIGLPLGIYIVFGKLLGVYLPYGKYFTLAF